MLKSWTMFVCLTIQKPGRTLYNLEYLYITKYYSYSNIIIKYLIRHMLLYIKYESRKDTVLLKTEHVATHFEPCIRKNVPSEYICNLKAIIN